MATALSIDDPPPIDGRTARAVRTRESIVDACISLIDDGDLRPTAPRISARAGVSVRSVFQHFADLETLFAAVGARVGERLQHLIVPIDPTLGLEERISTLVRQRSLLLEVVTPVRRAALMHAVASPEITRRLQEGHDFLRNEVAAVFATEIEAAGPEGADLLDVLDVALAWATWDTLRALGHRSEAEATATLDRMVRWTLSAAGVGL
ncbi:MAG: TetR family transcriptional regulator [Acidimicrobiales bacterium]|nr:TetR family transcriptional regulator [Acidimicrobiales bacterium]